MDFHLVAQYRRHTPSTLGYIDEYLQGFHSHNHIFLEFRQDKASKAQAKKAAANLKKGHKRQLQDAGKLSAAKRRRIAADNRQEVEDEMEEVGNKEAHFHFIKMHLISHFEKHVEDYGGIQMFSTEATETAHRQYIKDGYRRSNRHHATRQILATYGRQQTIRMRILTLGAMVRDGCHNREVKDVLHLTKDSGKNGIHIALWVFLTLYR